MPPNRNKRKYFHKPNNDPKRLKREQMTTGMTGFLISSSNNNEARCAQEAYGMLNDYMDIEMAKLENTNGEPSGTASDHATEKTCQEPNEDLEKALQDELAIYRTSSGMEERKARFKSVESGSKNLIFVSSAVSDPVEFAFNMMSDLHKTNKGKARFMQRVLPVVAVCRADVDVIKKVAPNVLRKYFAVENNPSYLVLFRARNTSLTMRHDEIISTVAEIIKDINPECRANLSDPDFAISVDVIRKMCCISLAKDFTKLKKYNVHVNEIQDGNLTRIPSEQQHMAAEHSTAAVEPEQIGKAAES